MSDGPVSEGAAPPDEPDEQDLSELLDDDVLADPESLDLTDRSPGAGLVEDGSDVEGTLAPGWVHPFPFAGDADGAPDAAEEAAIHIVDEP